MGTSRCHSFEDASSMSNQHASLKSFSRSESSQEGVSIKLYEFATINLPFHESPATSQISLSIRPSSPNTPSTPRLTEKKTEDAPSPERGRSRLRGFPVEETTRMNFSPSVSPDRFIPKRQFSEISSTSFRINKHPHQLSPEERILRRRLPGDDPFLPSRAQAPAFTGQRPTPIRLRQRPLQRPRLVVDPAEVGGTHQLDFLRRVSTGAVWGVGGTTAMLGDPSMAYSNGAPSLSGRGSAAPAYVAKFLPRSNRAEDRNKHESRLAFALNIDPTARLLGTCVPCAENSPSPSSPHYERLSPFVWKDCAWKRVERDQWPAVLPKREAVPPKPFRILDAPFLRDDFYCTTLAYSFTSGVLAVGLANHVYLWSESSTVDHPPFKDVHPSNFVTSLSFSSDNGGRSILAVGRQSGQLSLWGFCESDIRFELSHPNSISCVAFKPRVTQRLSEKFGHLEIDAEEIAVGDDVGNIWYYSVEWPENQNKRGWNGSITLLAKISAHTQQVCGLAWSPDERFLATGGNDNACLLFELIDILPPLPLPDYTPLPVMPTGSETLNIRAFPLLGLTNTPRQFFNRRHFVSHLLPSWVHPAPLRPTAAVPLLSLTGTLISGGGRTVLIPYDRQKHRLPHAAAVKAIAFAPWQPSLLATGGGSNDRAIHFFHARTGVCLATISVFAQVTSLIWSQTRREIVATFGYAQPEHPFRIAVFAWPSCAQVAVIPWGPSGSSWDGPDHDLNFDCGRALWAVSYPGRPPRPPIPTQDESDLFCASPRLTPVPGTRSQSPGRANKSGGPRPNVRIVRPKEKEGGMWCPRTMEEGCIIVASSDQTVKFHEVWTGRRRSTGSASGLLGGSDILEGMEGIEKSSSEVIR
ncbi:uncharacterized protein N7443_007016 [Penicillium atrosanguineum]|uniref:uncharacterized protein n=1 Tax=Penicillium atrosanguineum TaxID=1132637 RepID=UPI00238DD3F8|nr:uncharacterized protein N7443_007016 [Penicillium atrosanguineum]KAJ5298896.1 hypothetical protein N7443_007016 [Penicillium atrosanguineum]